MKYKLLFLLITLLIVSCGITDFEMPSWDVELTSIPLMNDDFPASDLEGENIIIEDECLIAFVEDELEEATPTLDKYLSDTTPAVQLYSNATSIINFLIRGINTDTDFRITEGKFESGEMLISYDGDFTDITTINLTFNQLYYGDQVVQLELTPEDFTDNQYILELANITIKDQDIEGEFWIINIAVTAMSSLPEGNQVGKITISIDDRVFFSSFTGFIDDIRALDSETDVEIDYPSDIENAVILDQISMNFYLLNQVGFNFELGGDLVAYRKDKPIDSINIGDDLDIDFTIYADTTNGAGVLTIIDVTDNERINQMLRKMPDKIAFLNPIYHINNIDGITPGYVSDEHKINCRYEIRIPLKATFNDEYLIYPDKIFEVVVSDDNQELIDKRVNSASMQLFITNDFPIGGVIDLYVSSFELAANSESLEQAELKFLNYGIEVSSNEQIYNLELSRDDITLFLRDKIFIRTRVRFYNSSGVVAILAEDNLKVKGFLNVSLKVESN